VCDLYFPDRQSRYTKNSLGLSEVTCSIIVVSTDLQTFRKWKDNKSGKMLKTIGTMEQNIIFKLIFVTRSKDAELVSE
jgi:hypothetical protein